MVLSWELFTAKPTKNTKTEFDALSEWATDTHRELAFRLLLTTYEQPTFYELKEEDFVF